MQGLYDTVKDTSDLLKLTSGPTIFMEKKILRFARSLYVEDFT